MLTVSAKASQSNIKPLEAGMYAARCVQLYDLGMQFNELANRSQRQVMIAFELPTERIEIDGEDKPRMMYSTYTASLNERSRLRKDLESWRGKPFTDDELKAFDLNRILNTTCMLSVSTKKSKTSGNEYAVISSIGKTMKGLEVAQAETTIYSFDLDADDALEQLESVPSWIAERIKKSETYAALIASGEEMESYDGKLPFDN